MRPFGLGCVVALLIGAATPATCQAPPERPPTPSAAELLAGSPAWPLLDQALHALAMTGSDLTFRTDYADKPDSFRTEAADSLLRDPMRTGEYVASLADEACAALSLERLLESLAAELDLDVEIPEGEGEGDPSKGASPPWSMEPKSLGPQPLDVLLPAMTMANGHLERAFSRLSEEERRFIALNAAVLLEEDEFDPDKPIDVRDREAEEDEILGDELLRIAGLVDYDEIARAGALIARAVDIAVPMAVADPAELPRRHVTTPGEDAFESDLVDGDVLNILETEAGVIILGGPGRTIYRSGVALVIDVGGDDIYQGDVAGALRDLPVSIVIDLAGDDEYLCGPHSLGAGFMGVGLLADLEGDDTYEAGDFSLGCGLFGVGILLDRDGNDSYAGDTCTEGAGAFGIGLLRDWAGNDVMRAALFSQGFGFVEGCGLLHDAGGNDLYFAGGKYTDEIRYFDHFLSLSQGFGFGWRPDASGGTGMLVDEAGNDVYISDIFGQGSSYWFSVGGLVDYKGNDQYVSYQYAQGAATHITVAALIDCEGDDNYVSKGVSQGCGHDLAIGLLHDLSGDDNYTCHDLSQGAGNANGIGALFDDAGNDAYSVRNPDNTHGYGNLRRDYGSLGLLIDASGHDSYCGRGADGTWWTYSDYGIGVDAVGGEEGDGQ